jgi:hypothetical protein
MKKERNTCNPSYMGGREQEDHIRSKLGPIVHKALSQNNQHKKKGLVEWLKSWFKPQYCQK